MMILFALLFAALPAGAESNWRKPLGPAIESLGAELRSGRMNADFPEGLLQGLIIDGKILEDRVGPVVERLETTLKLDAAAFSALTPRQQAEALALAVDSVVSDARTDAETLLLRSSWIDAAGSRENPAEIRSEMEKLLRRGQFFLPRDLRRRLDSESARLKTARRERVEQALTEEAAGLQVRMTKNFKADTKGFHDDDWRRLQAEIDKIGPLLASGKIHLGDTGNIKTFPGALRGISEIKFGTRGRYRVFFRYDPHLQRVALLRYVHRMKIEPESQAHRDLENWTDPAYLDSRLVDDPLALNLRPIIPVKRRVAVGKPFDVRKARGLD